MSDLSFLQKYTQTNMTLGINITQIQRNKLTKSGTHQLYRKSLSMRVGKGKTASVVQTQTKAA